MNLIKSLILCATLLHLALRVLAEPQTNAVVNPAPASTNLLAIYAPQDVSERAAGPCSTDSQASTPVLSDRDFVSYDWMTHKFKITADSAKRLSQVIDPGNPAKVANGETLYDLNFPDTSLALLISGKPAYSGMFSSPLSSMMQDCPVIRADGADSKFLPLDTTNAAALCILKARGAPDDMRSAPPAFWTS